MARLAGVLWNVPALRHLAAKVLLDENPGNDGVVTRALGHKRADTARQCYSGFATAAAIWPCDTRRVARRAAILRPRRRAK